jgi:hypothetical protein
VYLMNGAPRPDEYEGERDSRHEGPRSLSYPAGGSPPKGSVRSVGAELAVHGPSITAPYHGAQDSRLGDCAGGRPDPKK